MNLKLITGRTLDQGKTKDKNKLSEEYRRATGLVRMDKKDMEKLKVKEGETVLLKTDSGKVRLPVKSSKGESTGIVFIPMGPWANDLISEDTQGTGMPSFKSVPVEVKKTGKEPSSLDEVLGE